MRCKPFMHYVLSNECIRKTSFITFCIVQHFGFEGPETSPSFKIVLFKIFVVFSFHFAPFSFLSACKFSSFIVALAGPTFSVLRLIIVIAMLRITSSKWHPSYTRQDTGYKNIPYIAGVMRFMRKLGAWVRYY